jgi:fucose permease
MGLQITVVSGGPRLGDLESGAVAARLGTRFSVVSGGLACVVGALLLARALPGFRHHEVPLEAETAVAPATAVPEAG